MSAPEKTIKPKNADEVVKKAKPRSKDYPAFTLTESIDFVEKFKDFPLHKPISYAVAAKECNVSPTTKSFNYSISAARQYGLIGTSTGRSFTLLAAANRLIRPTEGTDALRALKIECFSTPKLYIDLISSYSGQSVPATNTLANVLVTYHGIMQAAAQTAAVTFIDTATEVGAIQNGILDLNVETLPVQNVACEQTTEIVAVADKTETNPSELPLAGEQFEKSEFAAPLNISFGDKRRAILYMPIDSNGEDAQYVRDMIALMFKRVYGVE